MNTKEIGVVIDDPVDKLFKRTKELFPRASLIILIQGSDGKHYSKMQFLSKGVSVKTIKITLDGGSVPESKSIIGESFRWNGSNIIDLNGISFSERLDEIKALAKV